MLGARVDNCSVEGNTGWKYRVDIQGGNTGWKYRVDDCSSVRKYLGAGVPLGASATSAPGAVAAPKLGAGL